MTVIRGPWRSAGRYDVMGKSKKAKVSKDAMVMKSFRVTAAMWARAKATAKRRKTDTSALVRKALGAELERG